MAVSRRVEVTWGRPGLTSPGSPDTRSEATLIPGEDSWCLRLTRRSSGSERSSWPGRESDRSGPWPAVSGSRLHNWLRAAEVESGQREGPDQRRTQGAGAAAAGQAATGDGDRDPPPSRGLLRPEDNSLTTTYPVITGLAGQGLPVRLACRVLSVSAAGSTTGAAGRFRPGQPRRVCCTDR